MEFHHMLDGCVKENRTHQKFLYERFYPTVFNNCMRYAPSKQDGEDFIQDCFLKVFKGINTFVGDDYAHLGGWIKRLCVNYAIDQSRKLREEVILDDTDNKNIGDVLVHEYRSSMEEETTELRYSSTEVMTAIQSLSPRYREVFNLYCIEGNTHKEIANILDISEGTSKSNYYKAKETLRKRLTNKKVAIVK